MADREHGRKWDGKSRIPDDTYRKNWNDIFGKKEEEEELDPETQEYVDSLKEKI